MGKTNAFRIGDWDVDPEQDLICHDERTVRLRPQIMDLLVLLAERSGSVVTPQEIMESLWERRLVTQASVYTSVGELRSALEDDPNRPRYIKTFPKRGYQLIAEVSRIEDQPEPAAATARWRAGRFGAAQLLAAFAVGAVGMLMAWQLLAPTRQASVRSEEPGPADVAVLPFELVGQFPDASYLSQGLAAEVQRRLSDDPLLRVTSPRSSFAAPASTEAPQTLAELLNTTHLLRGAIVESDNGLDVRVQLVGANGKVIWQRAYERGSASAPGLAAEIQQHVREVLAPDEPVSASVSTHRTSLLPEYSNWERYLIALEHSRDATKTGLMTAEAHLEYIIEAEPDHIDARILLAETYLNLASFSGYYGNYPRARAREAALPHLERALSLKPDSARAHAALGHLYLLTALPGDVADAEEHLQRAIELNQNLSDAHFWLGRLEQNRVRPWTVVASRFEKALSLDPLWQEPALAIARVLKHLPHRHNEAEEIIDRLRAESPQGTAGLRAAAELEITRGELATAAELLETALAISPGNSEVRLTLSAVLHSLSESQRADDGLNIWSGTWSLVLSDEREPHSGWSRNLPEALWEDPPVPFITGLAYTCVMIDDTECVQRLYERYRDGDAAFQEAVAGLDGTVYSAAASFATYLQATGRSADAESFIEREVQAIDIRTDGQRYTSASISRLQARVYALQGNRYAAQRALHNYARNGSLDPRVLKHPVYRQMVDSGELDTVRELMEKRREDQLKQYRRLTTTARLRNAGNSARTAASLPRI